MIAWPSPKIRVLVVDDSPILRKLISEALRAEQNMDIVGVAPNGRIALSKLEEVTADVVVLDLEMPEMDGLTTLAELRPRYPNLPVVLFSSLSERGAQITFEALALGASDYVLKPQGGTAAKSMDAIRNVLVPKIRALVARYRETEHHEVRSAVAVASPAVPPALESSRVNALVIGSSVGGPQALEAIIPLLPSGFRIPVFLVQHMPAQFTTQLARRLQQLSKLRVVEATPGLPVEPATVFVAPGDQHMLVRGALESPRIVLTQDPPENGCRPALDPLFRSAAQVYGRGLLALVMTGMGTDGTMGAMDVRQRGGRVWAQDERSSTIWGMPGSIVNRGLAERVCRLDSIAADLVNLVQRGEPPFGPAPGARRAG